MENTINRLPESPPGQVGESKNQLRSRLLAARKSLRPDNRRSFNERLTAEAARLVRLNQPDSVAAYSPMPDEPGGDLLVQGLLSVTSELWLPVSGSGGHLDWGRCSSVKELRRGRFGITEPTGPRSGSVPGNTVLIFCPALACARNGIRLGRGAGYYDRALADLDHTRCTVIAVLHPWELLDTIPSESHDVPVDGVLTPEGVRFCSPTRDHGEPGR
ncbi:5-formyltetrahydrofolate cyclo-ligase [Corynebacterium sp. CCM 9204]|uniref:5-formyltetrahydrofolate cyclo-ligase n=1 Tax=Corynebacterium sp. CCM 9204 TaxID=3057616 RepID=UPI0035242EFD